jgi:hypothetical protein
MKSILNLFIMISLSACAHPAKAVANCGYCADLKKIEQEYRANNQATGRERIEIQLRATAVIHKMPTEKDLKLSSEQVKSLVSLLRAGLPKDPGEALVMNNAKIINANRNAIDKEISALPKKEADFLQAALVGADAEDSDYSQETPPKK